MSNDKFKNKAKGIMDGLEDEENLNSKEEKSERIKDEKNKSSKEYKNKNSEEEKIKRSFTLTETQVEKIYLLKAKNSSMTLSEIVGTAIEKYYDQTD